MSSKKMVLTSTDGEAFEVEKALQSRRIKHMIEDGCPENDIHLPDVTSEILTMVLDYCKKHAKNSNKSDDELNNWDADFVKVDKATLFELILAARYLEIRGLRLTLQTVAGMIKGKSVKELRKTLNMENDFSPEEDEDEEEEGHFMVFIIRCFLCLVLGLTICMMMLSNININDVVSLNYQ